MTRYIPILFQTPMIQANHAGRKNQTRRLIKPQPELYDPKIPQPVEDVVKELNALQKRGLKNLHIKGPTAGMVFPNCPYGEVGDVLWVRETWCRSDNGFAYLAENPNLKGLGWRSSIHMPIQACRSWCVVEAIECQRFHHLSDKDAIGEGIEVIRITPDNDPIYRDYVRSREGFFYPKNSFKSLWVSINGLESWEANPWVWVVRYRHTTTPPDGWGEYVESVVERRKGK